MTHPVDLHVGHKLKELRTLHGWSQKHLSRKIGITFQQIQKYEKGTNRIAASRLFELANVFDVNILYFFTGLQSEEPYSNLNLDVENYLLIECLNKIQNETIKNALKTIIVQSSTL